MKDVTGTAKEKAKKQKTGGKRIRSLYILLAIALFIYYYVTLPAIHYAAIDFWFFVLLAIIGIVVIEVLADSSSFISELKSGDVKNVKWRSVPKKYLLLILPLPILWLVAMIGNLVFSPFFFSEGYSTMIDIEQADFATEFPQTDLNQITLIDRDTATRLGNRHLGALTNLVSQFEAADDYTQINIESYPYRVTPLEYAGFFKWLNNFREGIPHYFKVDNVTGAVTVETPEQPIKYSYSDMFNRDVMRKLRFSNPFTLFESPNFEVDDEGRPYYIATTYTRNFFLREPEANGLITLNAMTGETTTYKLEEIPSWVDRVHSSELILHQLEMNGRYQGGYWNSIFSKQGVTEPTAGYNYLPIDDDLYLYTGITSVVSDESNIGFVLVNMRTKDTRFYPLNAAEEFSAMQSAEGSVQETGYVATFPLLISIEGRPMYILSLKDSSGLIKEYALIDVQNYQNVYVESSVERLMLSYAEDNPINVDEIETEEELASINGQIEDIQAVVVEGNTIYYFMVDGSVYTANISLSEQLPFVEAGQEVQFTATENGVVRELEFE
ncbi:hypothetical protein ACTQ45_04175 [Fundicoccus sp. Sow4_D5]|uniref:hypothetical protein n=1 Tax=unclassified Fundicoccus TaxID=2761543 RepID=UPI003F912E88